VRRRLGLLAAGLVGLAACDGCGSSRYELVEPPVRPLAAFGSLDVKPLALHRRVDPDDDPDERAELAARLGEELREELAEAELLAGDGPRLVVRPRLDQHLADYAPLRLMGGGRLLEATVVLDIRLVDADGRGVARLQATGTSYARGWAVASVSAAEGRAIDAVLEFFEEQLPDR
jgi:hypothetical protein